MGIAAASTASSGTQGQYIAFYDGSASHLENYEEKTGLAVSSDVRSWETLTAGGPALMSEHATGSLRYLDAVTTDEGIWAFYECARADGAHDLSVARMEVDQLRKAIQPGDSAA